MNMYDGDRTAVADVVRVRSAADYKHEQEEKEDLDKKLRYWSESFVCSPSSDELNEENWKIEQDGKN